MTNEQLCALAKQGDADAQNLLIENNLRFIKKTAYEVWSAQRELNAALGIEINDLVRRGALGLLVVSPVTPGYRQQVSDLCSAGDPQCYGGLHTQL